MSEAVYYIKKLGHQELGSISASNPVPSRGRYFYISKNVDVLSFFPSLSSMEKNDTTLLPIIPIFNHHEANPEKVYCNFVYHNDMLFGEGTRNEYRIYLNNRLEGNELYFETEDIVVFRKERIIVPASEAELFGDPNNPITSTYDLDAPQDIFFLDCIKKDSSSVYKYFDDLVSQSPIRGGGHVIHIGFIREVETKISNIINHKNEINIGLDDTFIKEISREEKSINDLFNPVSFRDFVLTGYSNLCAVTKTVIKYGPYNNLDAAHIIPKSHNGSFVPSNGIALSKDIHWAFDKGLFTITDDLIIVVHHYVESNILNSFSGKSILIPDNDFFIPDKESLKYHRENIFGLFLTSGRL